MNIITIFWEKINKTKEDKESSRTKKVDWTLNSYHVVETIFSIKQGKTKCTNVLKDLSCLDYSHFINYFIYSFIDNL